jgi:AraC-like DNA-binding protein
MAGDHFLKRIRDRRLPRRAFGRPTVARLLESVSRQVVDRFAGMSTTDARAMALPVSELDEEEPCPNPSHPACAEFASSDYCRESWQLHLAKLRCRPETHWGTCEHKRLCAIVPIVCQNRCLAVVKLAGPAALLDRSEFRRHVDLLELLVRDFVVSQADFLDRVPGSATVTAVPQTSLRPTDGSDVTPSPRHPQVIRALEYVATHLADPRLTVGQVAAVLDICPTYLSQLFVDQVGQRMSRFIAARRVETAKNLLATTDWQIKRIALETGHANPNWFCHIFSVHVGLTPGEYRAAARAQDPSRPDR